MIDLQANPTRATSAGPGAPRAFAGSTVLSLLAIVSLTLIIYAARDLVFVLVLAGLVAYLVDPLVKIAESFAVKRSAALAMIYVVAGLIVAVTAYFLLPRLTTEVDTLSKRLPSFADRLDDAIDSVQSELAAGYPATQRWLTTRAVRHEKIEAFIAEQAENLPSLLGRLALLVLAAVLVPFFSYFFVRDGRKIIQYILDRLPARHIETSVAVCCEVNRIVRRYLCGLVIDGIIIGVTAGCGLWLLGINYPVLLGAFSGLVNVVPYFGPIIGGIAAMLVALVQFKSLVPLTNVFLLYAFIKLVDLVAVQPLTLSGGKELHPALLVGSIIVGGQAFGLIGMIVAVPTVTILQKIVMLWVESQGHPRRLAPARSSHELPVQPYVC